MPAERRATWGKGIFAGVINRVTRSKYQKVSVEPQQINLLDAYVCGVNMVARTKRKRVYDLLGKIKMRLHGPSDLNLREVCLYSIHTRNWNLQISITRLEKT